jgi:hypothetical protein
MLKFITINEKDQIEYIKKYSNNIESKDKWRRNWLAFIYDFIYICLFAYKLNYFYIKSIFINLFKKINIIYVFVLWIK